MLLTKIIFVIIKIGLCFQAVQDKLEFELRVKEAQLREAALAAKVSTITNSGTDIVIVVFVLTFNLLFNAGRVIASRV